MFVTVELNSLLGLWRLSRTVCDNSGQAVARMSGDARFSPIATQTLLYTENVVNKVEGGHASGYTARQSYRYVMEDHRLQIYFDEAVPRLFIALPIEALEDTVATHHCGNDLYSVSYSLFNPEQIVQRIEISGPRKRLQIETELLLIDS